MSMAAGEYVSVSSQADTERADIARERTEVACDIDAEIRELAGICTRRGVDPATADTVARQLMAKDALRAHAHDELGIWATTTARPIQAALTSAAAFTAGAALPLPIVFLAPGNRLVMIEGAASLLLLALLGAIGARAGGAPVLAATLRVTFSGALAMALTPASAARSARWSEPGPPDRFEPFRLSSEPAPKGRATRLSWLRSAFEEAALDDPTFGDGRTGRHAGCGACHHDVRVARQF